MRFRLRNDSATSRRSAAFPRRLGQGATGWLDLAWVVPGLAADKAGLAIGDVILRYNGIPLSDERALLRDIAHTPSGDSITFTAERDGIERDIRVVAEAWPRTQWEARDAPNSCAAAKDLNPARSWSQLKTVRDTVRQENVGMVCGCRGSGTRRPAAGGFRRAPDRAKVSETVFGGRNCISSER